MTGQQQRKKLMDDLALNTGVKTRIEHSEGFRREHCSNLSTNNCKTEPLAAATTTTNKNSFRNTISHKKRYPIVIFKWRQKMVTAHLIHSLTILLVLLACIESAKLSYCEQLENSRNPDGVFARNKRWTPQSSSDEIGSNQQQEQSQQRQSRGGQQVGIPAANPSFEAAFQGECGKNNNSNPCEHICLDLHDGTYECSCFYGFTLAVDGYSCAPITVDQQQQQHARTVAAANRADSNVPATLSASTGAASGASSAVNTAASVARATASKTSRPAPAANDSVLNSVKPPAVGPSESSSKPAEKSTKGNHFDASQQNSATADVVAATESTSTLYQPQATDSSGTGDNSSRNKNQPAEASNLNQANDHRRAHLPSRREGAGDNRKFAANDDEFARGVAPKLVPASERNEIESTAGSARFGASERGAGAGRRQSGQGAASLASNYGAGRSASEEDPAKPGRQRRLLEAAGRQEAKVALAAASDYVVDGSPPAAFRDPARWQTTTEASRSASQGYLKPRTLGAGGQYNKLMRSQHRNHHHHHHRHQGQRPDSEEASQPLRSPQMTTTNTNENGSNNNFYKEGNLPPSNGSSKNKGPGGDKLVSYDVEIAAAAAAASSSPSRSASLGMSASRSNGGLTTPNELIELNVSYEDADPDIRSIMMSNDKLVSQLASSVASAAAQTPPPPTQTNSNTGGKSQQQNGKQQEDGMMTVADEDDSDQAQDYDQSLAAAAEGEEEKEEEAAKTFGLLDSLVRRTIDEDYATQGSPFWSRQLELSQQRAQRWPVVQAEMRMAATNRINEPFLAEPNRSSGNRDASTSGGAGDNGDDNTGGGYILDGGEARSGGSRSRRSRTDADQLKMQQQQQTTDSSMVGSSSGSSFDSTNMVRLPSNQIDDTNRLCSDTDKPLEVYRDCSELPECESGGQCTVESRWISNKDSDSIQMESRARCRCPIGRGGQLCQKRGYNNNNKTPPNCSITAIQRKTPEFKGHSYLALPMITEPSLRNLRLVFKPKPELGKNREPTLLVYSQKFILLLDDLNRVELRYLTVTTPEGGGDESNNDKNNYEYRRDSSEVIRVIGSRDAELNKWNELIVTDASSSDSQTSFVAGLNRIVLVTPDKIELANSNASIGISQNISAEFFVAGLPDALRNGEDSRSQYRRQSTLGERLLGGFIGCISEFSLNQRVYNLKSDLNGDTLDGFDIGECCRPRESHQYNTNDVNH